MVAISPLLLEVLRLTKRSHYLNGAKYRKIGWYNPINSDQLQGVAEGVLGYSLLTVRL
jgi:hypothetical protein